AVDQVFLSSGMETYKLPNMVQPPKRGMIVLNGKCYHNEDSGPLLILSTQPCAKCQFKSSVLDLPVLDISSQTPVEIQTDQGELHALKDTALARSEEVHAPFDLTESEARTAENFSASNNSTESIDSLHLSGEDLGDVGGKGG
ncbi:3043_t:CDS:2, partial [Acaulospora colombiana]